MCNIDTLRQIPLFADLSSDQLQGVLQRGTILQVREGEVFVQEGEKAGDFFVLLKGKVAFRTKQLRDREMHFINGVPGDFFGHELILVETPLYLGSGCALCDSELLKLDERAFWAMVKNCPTVIQKLLRNNAQRWQNYEALLQSQAKLISLGTLAAGLAHELNNPAAAVLRSATHLNGVATTLASLHLKLNQKSLTEEQLTCLDELQHTLKSQIETTDRLDPLSQSSREDEMSDWLEAHNIPNSWQLAADLVAAGLSEPALETIAQHFPQDALAEVLTWLEAVLNQSRLMTEIQDGASRIAQLVGAIKDYSYMDQAPFQEIDIHDGLENTLTILAHKLSSEITVSREYTKNLPRIYACGSALNQVWTDLIDNAIEAMDGQGKLGIRTTQSGRHLLVEISDSGPGIPPDIQDRIFDPFFTTKAVGKGTGLGLDMARRIIVGQHEGDIQFNSQTGKTSFQVYLPILQRKSR